jgi:hypothetical protein
MKNGGSFLGYDETFLGYDETAAFSIFLVIRQDPPSSIAMPISHDPGKRPWNE